jgi:hypothetical protein
VPLEAVPLAVQVAVATDDAATDDKDDTSAATARNRPPLRAVRTA